MPKLSRLSARKVIKKLKKAGFIETHQRGSHIGFKSRDGSRMVVVPFHGGKDIATGTLHNIVVTQAGLTVEEFNIL